MIELSMHTPPPSTVDGSLLQPATLAMLASGDVERIRLTAGPMPLRVGDVFHVQADVGNDDRTQLAISGDLNRFDRVAAGMSSGSLIVEGPVGALCGMAMTGGRVEIRGGAADALAAGMFDGEIVVRGPVGDDVGIPLRGQRRGISGGLISIFGDCGHRCGQRMRRGTLVVTGSVGDDLAADMIAGTIAVLGDIGDRPAFGAQRGSILARRMHVAQPQEDRFTTAVSVELRFVELLYRTTPQLREAVKSIGGQPYRFWRQIGDRTQGGQAEWLTWQ